MLTLTNTWYIDVPLVLSNSDNIQIIFAKKRRRKEERYCVIEINCETIVLCQIDFVDRIEAYASYNPFAYVPAR